MRFLHPEHDEAKELSLDDVFIVPGRFDGRSRLEVDLTPVDFPGGSHPVVSANMNAVTGKRMAETMARMGGLGVLPQDMSLATVERIVRQLKSTSVVYDTPLSVTPDATIRDVLGLINKRGHDLVVVVDEARRPIGLLTHADLRERDQYTQAKDFMSRQLVTLTEGVSRRDAFLQMTEARVKSAPVIGKSGQLLGVLCREDVVRAELLRPALDAEGRLLVGAAIGISAGAQDTAGALREIGVDVLVLDTAHGHQARMLETVRAVRDILPPDAPLVAGNVCTASGTRDLIEAGASVVKVNVGPGAMCTTRMQTGCGRPTFTSVLACSREAAKHGRHVWADGGAKYPRDVALYLAAGASRVMVGTMLAGTYESPGDTKTDPEGRLYKENYGMASARAVKDRTRDLDLFEQAKKGFFREGISTSRIYMREGSESVAAILTNVVAGVQSAFTYVGALRCAEFAERAVVGVQTSAGYGEGKPRDIRR